MAWRRSKRRNEQYQHVAGGALGGNINSEIAASYRRKQHGMAWHKQAA